MRLEQAPLLGVWVAEAEPLSDTRGSFARWFCQRELASVIGERRIVQVNHSRTRKAGAVRGLHFQLPPHAEMKLVRCIRGRVWDVAVDIRAGSDTFLQWHGEELSPENGRMMLIPEGFAHGFQVLEPESELLYLHTEFYSPGHEGGIRWDDPALGIRWPLPVSDLSDRDRSHPLIDKDFIGVDV